MGIVRLTKDGTYLAKRAWTARASQRLQSSGRTVNNWFLGVNMEAGEASTRISDPDAAPSIGRFIKARYGPPFTTTLSQ